MTIVCSLYLMFFHVWGLVKMLIQSQLPHQENVLIPYDVVSKHVRITNQCVELLCFWLESLVLVAFANGCIVMGYNSASLVLPKAS